MLGGMLRILVVALVLLVAIMMAMPRTGDRVPLPESATILPEPLALPEVELVDQSGRRFSTTDLHGDFSLMFFGFTHCPDICPLSLQVLASARAQLKRSAPAFTPEVVFVSVDPFRDSAEGIRQYLANFDAEFTGVTASDEALAPLLKTLGVTVQKNEQDGEYYNVVHNSTVYLIGPEAQLIAIFGGSHDAAIIASDYVRIRRRLANAPTS